MGLLTALNAAVSGLRTTQAGMDLVSQNIANANSVGYSRRVMSPLQQVSGERTTGVRTGEVERVLDLLAQKQLRLETAGAAYTSLRAQFAGAMDRLFGEPGSAGSLDFSLNAFTQSLQGLLSDPGSYSARTAVLDQASVLASHIAQLSDSVQSLRTEAEGRIGAAVTRANELLAGIAEVNARIVASQSSSDPALLDDRDRLINELSKLMDVQTIQNQNGSVSLMTTAGLTLFDGFRATSLVFDGRSVLTPQSVYSTDSTQRSVGTITAVTASGGRIDILSGGLIRSGEIAAAVELRDQTLVQAQRQLDELAAGMARALSDRPAPVTAVAGGFDIDLAGLQAGNAVTLDVTVGGTPRRAIVIPTLGAAPNPIPPADIGDPNAIVIRWDISGGVNGASAGALQTALNAAGIDVNVTSPAANRLAVVNGATATVTGLAAAITETMLQSGRPQLPFFVDSGFGNSAFTGSFEGGSHLPGLAQRLAVNPDLLADRSKLVVFNTAPPTPQGDTARPQFLLDALTKTSRGFSATTGIGGNAPFSASVTEFARRIVETQGANAASAKRLDEGQQVALAAVESRFVEGSSVNIDQEMAQLVQLQTAYGANARVMTALRDMMDLLMRM